MTPGLVNAHTHLTLTALAGVVDSLPFAEWLPRLVAALRALGYRRPRSIRCTRRRGVTRLRRDGGWRHRVWRGRGRERKRRRSGRRLLLGASGHPGRRCCLSTRLPEVSVEFGRLRPPCACADSLRTLPTPPARRCSPRSTTRPRDSAVPTAIHVAESSDEVRLLLDGTGPLAGTAQRTAFGFEPPGSTTAAYLDRLGGPGRHDGRSPVSRDRGRHHLARAARARRRDMPALEPLPWQPTPARHLATRSRNPRWHRHGLLGKQLRPRPAGRTARPASHRTPSEPGDAASTIATRGWRRGHRRRRSLRHARYGQVRRPGHLRHRRPRRPGGWLIETGGGQSVAAVMSGGEWRVRDGALLRDGRLCRTACDARARALSPRPGRRIEQPSSRARAGPEDAAGALAGRLPVVSILVRLGLVLAEVGLADLFVGEQAPCPCP